VSAEFRLPDDAATAELGTRLAARLRPGDIVALSGDLGAGKTALARAVIRTLAGDAALDVPSPTFALVQPYAADAAPLLHADLYRLGDASEVDELGLFDDPSAIVLVEWPERAPDLLARADVTVMLGIPSEGAGRTAQIAFADGRVL